jgi:cellulose synthase/poly-beta-1,6-N-acetylglucosamine synthase-like glycosyltransferase
LTLLGCVVAIVVTLGLFCLLALHLALRRERLVREARDLARPLPPDAELPHVVVQIPVFNEGALVERAVANAARFDWPREKLHIQVCDDSSDGTTTRLALAATQRVAATGIDAAVVRRSDRSGFKAGSLNNAMAHTPHGYFAILDVDFVSPADFLRRCMPVMLENPALGFVQARMDFLNAGETALTRAQAVLLDYHYGFEQAIRTWADQFLPFDGSCGIWRRAAIEAAGGWKGDTLLEDWDLSYRAWLKGWRGTFITSVSAAGELPVSLRAWMAQQRRWAAGGGQVALRMLPEFGRRRPLRDHWDTLVPVGSWLAYGVFSATLIGATVAVLLRPASAWMLLPMLTAVFGTVVAAFFATSLTANRTVGRNTPLLRFVFDFPLVLMLALYFSWANLRSLPGTLLGRPRVFVPTPKRGSLPDTP